MTRRVIAFAGKAGSGKSTIAKEINRYVDGIQFSFAEPLKKMLRTLLLDSGMSFDEAHRALYVDKLTPLEALNDETPRHAMQTLGTEWGRNCMGEDFWARQLIMYAKREPSRIVVDDVRFQSEIDVVHELGGIVIWINRTQDEAKPDNHPSENSIGPEDCDAVVWNNGTIDMLKHHIIAKIL